MVHARKFPVPRGLVRVRAQVNRIPIFSYGLCTPFLKKIVSHWKNAGHIRSNVGASVLLLALMQFEPSNNDPSLFGYTLLLETSQTRPRIKGIASWIVPRGRGVRGARTA
jgi:hypothetical protein